jgi:hypothetical protein
VAQRWWRRRREAESRDMAEHVCVSLQGYDDGALRLKEWPTGESSPGNKKMEKRCSTHTHRGCCCCYYPLDDYYYTSLLLLIRCLFSAAAASPLSCYSIRSISPLPLLRSYCAIFTLGHTRTQRSFSLSWWIFHIPHEKC